MHGYFNLYAATAKNGRGQVEWKMDIAAPTERDALYVAKQALKDHSKELEITLRQRVRNGTYYRVLCGYISSE